MTNTVSVKGMFRRKTTMLKNANGMIRRGKAIRYMTLGFLHVGVARETSRAEARSAPRQV
jgi:hypothetical protein